MDEVDEYFVSEVIGFIVLDLLKGTDKYEILQELRKREVFIHVDFYQGTLLEEYKYILI